MVYRGQQRLNIWHFISGIVFLYGVIIIATGLYYFFGEPASTELAELHPSLWWGGLLVASSAAFYWIARKSM